jgi:lipopolysaccharide/colanic/teichoic acid biosynthesis glycosyltransferase
MRAPKRSFLIRKKTSNAYKLIYRFWLCRVREGLIIHFGGMPSMTESIPELTYKRIAAPRFLNQHEWKIVRVINDILRRGIEIVAAMVGLVLLSPVFGIVSLTIKRESAGPIFYRGKRAGLNGKPFWILKFRTMYENPACHNGPAVTAAGDARVTPLGHWLRKTKINELPQLWNVLRGEMGLVGPRPEDYEIAMSWPSEIRAEVLSARPGITSPASVVYRDEENLLKGENLMDSYLGEVLPSKLRLDLLYIRHRTVMSDLDVIFWTGVALLPRLRHAAIPENLLLWGPLSHFFSRVVGWFIADCLIALTATGAAELIWRMSEPLNLGWEVAFLIGLATAFVFSVTNLILGVQNVEWHQAPSSEVLRLALSTFISVGFIIWIDVHQPVLLMPTQMITLAGGLAFSGFVSLRYRERLFTGFASRWMHFREDQSQVSERVLLVGAGGNGSIAAWLLRRSDFAHLYRIVGIVDDNPRKFAKRVEGHQVLGTSRDLPRLVHDLDVGLIIYTIENIGKEGEERILKTCRETSARVVELPEMMRLFRSQLKKTERENGMEENAMLKNNSTKDPSGSDVISTDAAIEWLNALDRAAQHKNWLEVEAQVEFIRSEIERNVRKE